MKQVKARYCVIKKKAMYLYCEVWKVLILKHFWMCGMLWKYDFVTNGGKITDLQRRSILISWSAYAIMPVGKKDMTMFHVNKERTPVCTTNTCEGSSLFISVVEYPLGYSLSLLWLSNHLQMRWQVTPAATATKKDMTISMCSPPPPRCRVSVGQRSQYNTT